MRALRIARLCLAISIALWAGALLLGLLGFPALALFGIALYAGLAMGPCALACVVIQLTLYLRRRKKRRLAAVRP